MKDFLFNLIFFLLVGFIIGVVVGEKSQCKALNYKYDWDTGSCILEK